MSAEMDSGLLDAIDTALARCRTALSDGAHHANGASPPPGSVPPALSPPMHDLLAALHRLPGLTPLLSGTSEAASLGGRPDARSDPTGTRGLPTDVLSRCTSALLTLAAMERAWRERVTDTSDTMDATSTTCEPASTRDSAAAWKTAEASEEEAGSLVECRSHARAATYTRIAAQLEQLRLLLVDAHDHSDAGECTLCGVGEPDGSRGFVETAMDTHPHPCLGPPAAEDETERGRGHRVDSGPDGEAHPSTLMPTHPSSSSSSSSSIFGVAVAAGSPAVAALTARSSSLPTQARNTSATTSTGVVHTMAVTGEAVRACGGGEEAGRATGGATVSTPRDNSARTGQHVSRDGLTATRSATRVWTDTQLLQAALRRGVSAASAGRMTVAANDFALIVKLLAKKCYVVEELVMDALTPGDGSDSHSNSSSSNSSNSGDSGSHHRLRKTRASDANESEPDGVEVRGSRGVQPDSDTPRFDPDAITMSMLPPGLDDEDYEEERKYLEAKQARERASHVRLAAAAAAATTCTDTRTRADGQQRQTKGRAGERSRGGVDPSAAAWVARALAKVHPDALPLSTLQVHCHLTMPRGDVEAYRRRQVTGDDVNSGGGTSTSTTTATTTTSPRWLQHGRTGGSLFPTATVCSPRVGWTDMAFPDVDEAVYSPTIGSPLGAHPRESASALERRRVDPLAALMPALKTSSDAFGFAAGAVSQRTSSCLSSTTTVSPAGGGAGFGLVHETGGEIGNPSMDVHTPATAFSLTALFSALLWNIALSLWEDGHVEDAYQWLCVVDMDRLRAVARQVEEADRRQRRSGGGARARLHTQEPQPLCHTRSRSSPTGWAGGGGGSDLHAGNDCDESETGREVLPHELAAMATRAAAHSTLSWEQLILTRAMGVALADTPHALTQPTGASRGGRPQGRGTNIVLAVGAAAPVPLHSAGAALLDTGAAHVAVDSTGEGAGVRTRGAAAAASTSATRSGPERGRETPTRVESLWSLAAKIASLRDLCALMVSCESTDDVLYLVRQIGAALRERDRHLSHAHTLAREWESVRGCSAAKEGDEVSGNREGKLGVGERVAPWPWKPVEKDDGMAEVLLAINLLVEFFLAKRARMLCAEYAQQHAKLLASTDSYYRQFGGAGAGVAPMAGAGGGGQSMPMDSSRAPASTAHPGGSTSPHAHTATGRPPAPPAERQSDEATAPYEDRAVTAACDELVCAFTAGRCFTLRELEHRGMPTPADAGELLAADLPYTLALNVFSAILNYASLFRLSRVYHGVVAREAFYRNCTTLGRSARHPSRASAAAVTRDLGSREVRAAAQGGGEGRGHSLGPLLARGDLSGPGASAGPPTSNATVTRTVATTTATTTTSVAPSGGKGLLSLVRDAASELFFGAANDTLLDTGVSRQSGTSGRPRRASAPPSDTAHTLPAAAVDPADYVQAEWGSLPLPSRVARGEGVTHSLPLLPEFPTNATVSGGERGVASTLATDTSMAALARDKQSDVALRLLLVLTRFRAPSNTLEVVPAAIVQFVAQELNKAMYMMQAELRRRRGSAWYDDWRARGQAEVRRFYTDALEEVQQRLPLSAFASPTAGDAPRPSPNAHVSSIDASERVSPPSMPCGHRLPRGPTARTTSTTTTTTATTAMWEERLSHKEGSPARVRQTPTDHALEQRRGAEAERTAWWGRPLSIPTDVTLREKKRGLLSASPSVLRLDHGDMNDDEEEEEDEEEKGEGLVLDDAGESAGHGRKVANVAHTTLPVAWDAPPPFIPDVTIDFSAFTTTSVETQLATKRMVADAVARQRALESVCRTERARQNVRHEGVSLLSAACRQLLHSELPMLQQYCNWRVIYSTRFHGVSFQTLLKACQQEGDAAPGAHRPMLLVMELSPSTTKDFAADGEGVEAAARAAAQALRDADWAMEQQHRAARTRGGATGCAAPPRPPPLAAPAGRVKQKTTNSLIVGAYLSDLLTMDSRRFYGSGETFVFHMFLPATIDDELRAEEEEAEAARVAGVAHASTVESAAEAAEGVDTRGITTASATKDAEESNITDTQSCSSPYPPQPLLRVYHSSNTNSQYINCRLRSVVVGGGGGGSAIFLDDSLMKGATSRCATFASPLLTRWKDDKDAAGTYSGGEVSMASFDVVQLEAIVMD